MPGEMKIAQRLGSDKVGRRGQREWVQEDAAFACLDKMFRASELAGSQTQRSRSISE